MANRGLNIIAHLLKGKMAKEQQTITREKEAQLMKMKLADHKTQQKLLDLKLADASRKQGLFDLIQNRLGGQQQGGGLSAEAPGTEFDQGGFPISTDNSPEPQQGPGLTDQLAQGQVMGGMDPATMALMKFSGGPDLMPAYNANLGGQRLTEQQRANQARENSNQVRNTETNRSNVAKEGMSLKNYKLKLREAKYGKPSAGYAFVDPDDPLKGMIAVPGGPIALKQTEQDEKKGNRKLQTGRAGTTVIQDLQRALNIVTTNRLAVGAPTLLTKLIPESEAQAAEGMIQSALSNVGLDTLQQMRENSPTGGALGQVPIQQQKRLEQVLGSLDLNQKPEIVKANLKRVINIYMDIVYGTPEQIAGLTAEGLVDPNMASDISFRYQLPFDDFGRPTPTIPTVTNRSEYNELPSGALFMEDGQQYRKP